MMLIALSAAKIHVMLNALLIGNTRCFVSCQNTRAEHSLYLPEGNHDLSMAGAYMSAGARA